MSHHGRQVSPGFWSSSDVSIRIMSASTIQVLNKKNIQVLHQIFAFIPRRSLAGEPILDRRSFLYEWIWYKNVI